MSDSRSIRLKAKVGVKLIDGTSGNLVKDELKKVYNNNINISSIGNFMYNACFVNFPNEESFSTAVRLLGPSCTLNIANVGEVEFEVSNKENNKGGVNGTPNGTPTKRGGATPCREGLKCYRSDCNFYHPPCDDDEINNIRDDAIWKQEEKIKSIRRSIDLKYDEKRVLQASNSKIDAIATVQEVIAAMEGNFDIAQNQLDEFNNAFTSITNDRFGLMQLQREVRRLQSGLPFYAFRRQVVEAVRLHNVVIIIGETGSGKSTQVSYIHFSLTIFNIIFYFI